MDRLVREKEMQMAFTHRKTVSTSLMRDVKIKFQNAIWSIYLDETRKGKHTI